MTNPWLVAAGVAVLGGVGSMLRFALSRWQNTLPWGILSANTVASVLVGFCVVLGGSGHGSAAVWGTLLATGLAGGLSTFSSWAAQTVGYFAAGKGRAGYLNVMLNLVLPVGGAIAGLILGTTLLK